MNKITAHCLVCGAVAVQRPPHPQLCITCKAHGVSWALRQISAECDTLSARWESAVAALSEAEQARFTRLRETWRDLVLTGSYYAKHEARLAFWKRIEAIMAKGDAFGDAVAMWQQHQDRKGNQVDLSLQQEWIEWYGQGEMDI